MKTLRKALCILLVWNTAGLGWGPMGHMMVAAIAWRKLDQKVKDRIAELLKENPEYDNWVEGVPDADKAEIAFITAATWPDFIKSADGDTNDGEHPASLNAGDNIGYDDKLQHRYWHFFDTTFSADDTPTRPADAVNALTQIRYFTRSLKTKKDESILSYDIVWLEHIVGDLHQPLHATARFDEDDPMGDSGGNRVLVCSAPPANGDHKKCKTKLHGYWDGLPGSGDNSATARTRAAGLPTGDETKAADLEPAHWIKEF